MPNPIYLDYNATTPLDQAVIDEVMPFMTHNFGNAASKTHLFGDLAGKAVSKARTQVAQLINAQPYEIILTSGATEAINLALKGVFESAPSGKDHIITVKTEHKAVLDTCEYLEKKGARVTYLDVDQQGLINLEQLSEAITNKTLLIALMYGNNETGVIQPINDAAEIAEKNNVLFLTDATQAVGKIPVDVRKDRISMMMFSGHKLYAPKGVGALYVRKEYQGKVQPLIHGGGHEQGLRSGTLNVAGIVGFGKACELCIKEDFSKSTRITQLRDLLEKELLNVEDTSLNGSTINRLPNTTNICFKGVEADELIMRTRTKLAVATGSACTSSAIAPSHVLQAMGLTDELAYSSIRFSLGRYTSRDEIEQVTNLVEKEIIAIRKLHRLSA
ncbi:MAG: cysteine desulfurase family protein [Balneolales bacterium]